MMNHKGYVSMNVIIISAIALLVLVILAVLIFDSPFDNNLVDCSAPFRGSSEVPGCVLSDVNDSLIVSCTTVQVFDEDLQECVYIHKKYVLSVEGD